MNFYDCNQFNKAVFNKFILKTNAPDNCCSLKDGSIIIICNFIENNDGIVIIGTKYKTLSDFYVKPCKSSKLGIHLVENIGNSESWNLEQIKNKCLKLKFKNKFVVFPLLHSE